MGWLKWGRRKDSRADGDPNRWSDIRPGTTIDKVVDLLGPPSAFLDEAGLFGESLVLGPVPSDRRLSWLYLDVPEPGDSLGIAFLDGRVTAVDPRPADPDAEEERARIHNPWAEEVVSRHLEKMKREFPDQPTDRPAWRHLTGPEVMHFVLTLQGSRPDDLRRLGSTACRFGSLDVIASIVDVDGPELARTYLPDGYFAELLRLVNGHGLAAKRYDIAHLILCNPQDGPPEAHLAYLPSEPGVRALAPWDLLRSDEKGEVDGPLPD